MTRAPQFNRPRRRDAPLPDDARADEPVRNPAGSALPLPHERDGATGHVASEPDPQIRQAKRDLDAGLVDTDMHATAGLDAGRREKMVPTPRPDAAPTTRRVGMHPQADSPDADSEAPGVRRG